MIEEKRAYTCAGAARQLVSLMVTISKLGEASSPVSRTQMLRPPSPIIIPCHRAIGSDGRLVGYAGGLDRKRWLLAHEAGQVQPIASVSA